MVACDRYWRSSWPLGREQLCKPTDWLMQQLAAHVFIVIYKATYKHTAQSFHDGNGVLKKALVQVKHMDYRPLEGDDDYSSFEVVRI